MKSSAIPSTRAGSPSSDHFPAPEPAELAFGVAHAKLEVERFSIAYVRQPGVEDWQEGKVLRMHEPWKQIVFPCLDVFPGIAQEQRYLAADKGQLVFLGIQDVDDVLNAVQHALAELSFLLKLRRERFQLAHIDIHVDFILPRLLHSCSLCTEAHWVEVLN